MDTGAERARYFQKYGASVHPVTAKIQRHGDGEIRVLAESFESSELLSASLYMMRLLAALSESVGDLIEQSTQD